MSASADARFMARAIELARRGLYTTDPNPRVGCVLVKGERVVGEGWHVRAGEAHAEIAALAQAGASASGATAYVTLEPCCHHGRTPPCTTALIEAGVENVVAAMRDPNPRVAGRGFAALESGRVTVRSGVLRAEAEKLNPGFIQRLKRGRPFVRLKIAASLDGRTALASGESKWITGEAARADVQRWRARSSAIVTGIGTVLADDPRLDVRVFDIGRQPLRVVLDSRLRTPPTARMLSLPGDSLIVTADAVPPTAALQRAGAEVLCLPGADGRVDIAALLQQLAAREMNEVLVEAGAGVCGAFLAAGIADELLLYYAPHILGDSARGMFGFPVLKQMHDRISLKITDQRMVGTDLRIIAQVVSEK